MTTETKTDKSAVFADLGLAPKLVSALHAMGAKTPTPIQHQAIPVVLQGVDVVGIAQTGTGKTFAFGLPLIQNIAKNKCMGLIILPTRELAQQVDEALRQVGRNVGLRTAVIIGGESMGKQLRQLKNRPHVIIGTPGRLNDHLQQRTLRVDRVGMVVLDEADRMLDMGFLPQITSVLRTLPKQRQMLLFSATMPSEIFQLASSFMKMPVRIEVAPAGTAARDIEQEVIFVAQEKRVDLLAELLDEEKGTVLVFSRTKRGATRLTRQLYKFGHTVEELHSDRSLGQRRRALENFKKGKSRVLIATDIAARGIDVAGISLVINFDLPDRTEDYVHRIGRTARAGRSGKAVSFAMPDQLGDVQAIEKLMRIKLPRSKKSLEVKEAPVNPRANRRSSGFGRGGFGRRSGGRRSSGGFSRGRSFGGGGRRSSGGRRR